MANRWRYAMRAAAVSSLLAAVMLAACGGSTTVQCPLRPAPTSPDEWVQAPGEVAMALTAPVFGTDEYVQAAVFNHTQVIIETPPY